MSRIVSINLEMIVFFLLLQPLPVPAFSLQQLLDLDNKKENTKDQIPNTTGQMKQNKEEKAFSKAVLQQITSRIDLGYIQNIIVNLNNEQRKTLLKDKTTFQKFIQSEADSQSILSAALANNLDQDPHTLFLVQRGAAQTLKELYISRLMREKIPNDFPNEQQIIDYYDQNTEQFMISKRMHIWQIFLPIKKDGDPVQIDRIKKKAKQIVRDIKNKKTDFTTAAQELDQQNSGYIGLFKISQLVPKIKKTLLKLKEGEPSDPVQTGSGIHIVKRGAILDEELISLATATPEIEKALIIKARKKLQRAIYEQARKSYPTPLTEQEIEAWRLRLKANTNS